jgi:hypothetical protein
MSRRRRRFVAVMLASSIGAVAVSVAIAAKDPRGPDLRDEGDHIPSPLESAPDVSPLQPSLTDPPLRRNPLWGISLKSLSATRERPLFTPSRRPPVRAVAPPAVAPVVRAPTESVPPPLDLLGLVIGTDDGYAVFINTATHDIVRLRRGEGYEGWILKSVKGREVELEKNLRTLVVAFPQPNGEKK